MTLDFNYDNRHYSISFMSKAIQIVGEAAAGKSLMFQDLRYFANKSPSLQGQYLFVNHANHQETDINRMTLYKFVVIDNADIILTPEIERLIIQSQLEEETQWVLLGRSPLGCIITNSVGKLICEERDGQYYFYVDYKQR